MMNSQKTICIIDDEPTILKMYAQKFNHDGYLVQTYDSGAKALTEMKKNVPDLILLDIYMPGMDGFTVMSELRKDQQLLNVPVIFLTNLDDDETKRRGIEMGALYFLSKTKFLPSDLSQIVKEVLTVEDDVKVHQ